MVMTHLQNYATELTWKLGSIVRFSLKGEDAQFCIGMPKELV